MQQILEVLTKGMKRSNHKVQLMLTNLTDSTCTVSFEPKGAQAQLPVGEVFVYEISGPGDGLVEVSFDRDGLSIGEWDGAQTRVRNKRGDNVVTY